MHYNISRERFDALTTVFESFNANFVELQGVFKEVTGEDFVPGQRFHPTTTIKKRLGSQSDGKPENLDDLQQRGID